jgi:hypothetical protein
MFISNKKINLILIILAINISCKKSSNDLVQNNIELFVLSPDKPISYFTTKKFLEKAMTEPNLPDGVIIYDETKSDGMQIYFGAPDETKFEGLRKYYGGRLLYDSNGVFWYDSDTILRFFEYANYNIILVTQEFNDIEYVRDYLFLKKQNPETYLHNSAGAITINEESPGCNDVIVVVNHYWRGRFTDDISQVFKINMQTRKIEPIIYDTIRLYSEL